MASKIGESPGSYPTYTHLSFYRSRSFISSRRVAWVCIWMCPLALLAYQTATTSDSGKHQSSITSATPQERSSSFHVASHDPSPSISRSLGRTSPQYSPTWLSLDYRPLPTWYDDAKIGIFIHWGVFSVPSFGSEGFWYHWKAGRKEYTEFMYANYRANFTYAEFALEFTAHLFDPDQWAHLFKPRKQNIR